MTTKTLTFALIATVCVTALASPVMAQTAQPNNSGAWRGQDNEFGHIRTPYMVDMDGARVPVEAQVILRENYEEKDSRFFMFAFTVENTPLDVTFDHLIRMDTGAELPCYQRQGEGTGQLKCFVDLKDMPPAGTEIVMQGTAGASRAGSFPVGAIVVPFTYTWGRVAMSNGLEAELYGSTTVNVMKTTGAESNAPLGGVGNKVPGLGALGVVAAGMAAVGLLAYRRRN